MEQVTQLKLVPSGFVGVRIIASRYGISKSTLYDLIRSDPNFPYVNVGLKKKIMINAVEFDSWLQSRTKEQKAAHFKLPTADELLKKYKK